MRIARVIPPVVAVALLAGGCAPHFAVRYPVDDVRALRDPALASLSVRISPLHDGRGSAPESIFIFSTARETEVGGQKSCVNAELNYREPKVTEQVADAIALHLGKMQTYAKVATTELPNSYVLTGTLRRFYGVQDTSGAAQAGAAFGLIGALATMNATSNGSIDIELTNLELIGPDGQKVGQLADIHQHYDGELPADADCNAIFGSVNRELKGAVDKLARRLAAELHQALQPKAEPPAPSSAPAEAPPAAEPPPAPANS